ncbi:ABC transporter substrate-binding protein [Photobacterium sp. NCIMB 13483]|uniref:Periplasmic solute binding protein family protein n=1 Tax=Photobacterium piscicola TaxID=1378299 RepID=A0A1T5HW45_9GAMM|nr:MULTISPECIES: ABC transporter substrate-binding protein [Photobacterium]PST94203.1 ABC transporter substrate-binding protein [Photobacterium sp. NCIMB 13483]SKC31077.1 Periplasmic solute binding protein family protein [Photobacterium piscicola]
MSHLQLHPIRSLIQSVCAVAIIVSGSSYSHSAKAEDILTATPVTYMLASELTHDTGITTKYLPPKRYGVSRLPNWFASKGDIVTQEASKDAQAVVTLGAVWPQDPLYIYARQGNINIIEIDASQAISPQGQGIAALRLDDGSVSMYSWLNPTNLSRMAAIVSDDLQRLWPNKAQQIEQNQQQLMGDVRKLINAQQQVLMDAEIDSVVLLSTELEDFASGNQLFVVDRLTKPELEWTVADKQKLTTLLAEDKALWLLSTKKLTLSQQALLPKGTSVLIVDSVDRWGRVGINHSEPLKRWQIKL